MKVVLVAGEPATGKSTLATSVIKSLGLGVPFKDGLVVGTKHGFTYVLGVYGAGEGFWGTDRLSMALMPQLKQWLGQREPYEAVFMEGDRVTSKDFIDHLRTLGDLTVIVLTASDFILEKRQKARGNKQSPTFLKGRRTKINKIVDAGLVTVFHETETSKIRDFVLLKLGASDKIPLPNPDARI